MANNYDNEALIEMCNKIDLLEYASENMDFEKRGSDSFATHCPLHVDKTASLFITPSKNMFHCFSCGTGGNIINWLMTFEKLSFNEAVDKVGKLTGIDIKNLKQCTALKIFKTLKSITETKNKCDLLSVRKFLPDTELEKYQDEIPEEWIEEGIRADVMKKFDIRIDNRTNRIVYPVYDNDFNLIGIKGRTRYKNYKALNIQKYMNYHKIHTTDFFIGMKENIESIKKHNEVIIFEGIKSVMKAYGWGYDYCVAAETSRLNDEQIKILISMGIKNIAIAFDNDVSISKIRECTYKLKKFANVYAILDRANKKDRLLVEEKLSPCDKGKDVWEILYKEKRRV